MKGKSGCKSRRGLSAVCLGLGLALAVVVSGCGASPTASSFLPKTTKATTSPAKTKPTDPALATADFLGPDGVVSPSEEAENKLPGTTAWEIPPHSGPDGIEGFANMGNPTVGTQVT